MCPQLDVPCREQGAAGGARGTWRGVRRVSMSLMSLSSSSLSCSSSCSSSTCTGRTGLWPARLALPAGTGTPLPPPAPRPPPPPHLDGLSPLRPRCCRRLERARGRSGVYPLRCPLPSPCASTCLPAPADRTSLVHSQKCCQARRWHRCHPSGSCEGREGFSHRRPHPVGTHVPVPHSPVHPVGHSQGLSWGRPPPPRFGGRWRRRGGAGMGVPVGL